MTLWRKKKAGLVFSVPSEPVPEPVTPSFADGFLKLVEQIGFQGLRHSALSIEGFSQGESLSAPALRWLVAEG